MIVAEFVGLSKALYPRGYKKYIPSVEEAKEHAKAVARSKGHGGAVYSNELGQEIFTSYQFK